MKRRTWAARLLGIDLSPALMPLWGVMLLSSWAFSALWSFVGIWAIHVLGATSTTIGIMYGGDSLASALGGYYGGRLSDRVGRRGVIGAAWALEAVAALALALVGHHVMWGMALVVVAGAASGPGFAATGALVADLSNEKDQSAHYGAYRVVSNLGAMAGPALGGLALVDEHWPLLFGGIATMGLTAAVMAWRWLPSAGAAPIVRMAKKERAPHPSPFRDAPFLLLLASTFGGFLVYIGFDVVLPIATVHNYGLKPAIWGFLTVANPLMVVALQAQMSDWTSQFQPDVVLLFSMSLMGFSFLLLLVRHGAAFILISLLLFGLGEMVWSPTAQVAAARLASDDVRGAYMGALGASGSAAWILGPLIDLQLAATGVGGVWILLAGCGAVAGALGWGAVRLGAAAVHPGMVLIKRSERRSRRPKEQ